MKLYKPGALTLNFTVFLYLVCSIGSIREWKEYERGTFFVKSVILKGKGLDLGAEPPCIKLC